MELRCTRCDFKWKPRTNDIPKTCPFCGKENTITYNAPDDFQDIDNMLK